MHGNQNTAHLIDWYPRLIYCYMSRKSAISDKCTIFDGTPHQQCSLQVFKCKITIIDPTSGRIPETAYIVSDYVQLHPLLFLCTQRYIMFLLFKHSKMTDKQLSFAVKTALCFMQT